MDVSAYYIRQKSSRVTNSMPPSTGFHQPPALCKIKSTLFLVHRLFLFRFQKLVRIITPDFCFVKGIFLQLCCKKGRRSVAGCVKGLCSLRSGGDSRFQQLRVVVSPCRAMSFYAACRRQQHYTMLSFPRTADSRKRTAASALTPSDERASPCPHHQ